MWREAARHSMNVDVRLTAMTSSHWSSFITMKRLSLVRPALLTMNVEAAADRFDRLVDQFRDAGAVGEIAGHDMGAVAEFLGKRLERLHLAA